MLGTIDPRDRELARTLVTYSTATKKDDLVFIQCNGYDTLNLGHACVEEAIKVGAAPYIQFVDHQILRTFMRGAKENVFKRLGKYELKQMKDADVFIGIRGTDNAFELSDVPRPQLNLYQKHIGKPVHLGERVKRTRWVVLRYPNSSFAQMAQQSQASFADFYYRVCLVDFAKMNKAVQPLKKMMANTDKIRIKGPGTDLELSIKGIGVVECCGDKNIPDGECYSAPVKTSMNGTVQFNTPTVQDGAPYDNIFLRFKDGKAVEARAANADQTERLNKVLDQDPGARYVGEFAIGFHPHILHAMRDILFDEKIAGSFHMAMGACYDEASNGNKSGLHWDLVCIQRPEYGGGEMWFDGKLVRKDGEFVVPELKGLNRANYK